MKAIICTKDCEVCFETFHKGDYVTKAFAEFITNGESYTIAQFHTIISKMTNILANKTINELNLIGHKGCFKEISIK